MYKALGNYGKRARFARHAARARARAKTKRARGDKRELLNHSGAGGGGRTPTGVTPADFEADVKARNCNISQFAIIYYLLLLLYFLSSYKIMRSYLGLVVLAKTSPILPQQKER